VLATLTAMSGAASLIAIPEPIPTAIRSTTLSLVYAIAATVFGGTTQLVVTRLIVANRVVLGDEVVQTLGQQRHLLPVLALNESRHMSSVARYVRQLYGSVPARLRGFHTPSTGSVSSRDTLTADFGRLSPSIESQLPLSRRENQTSKTPTIPVAPP
jgi:hypothetical protein